jgi:WD40 repeat protein
MATIDPAEARFAGTPVSSRTFTVRTCEVLSGRETLRFEIQAFLPSLVFSADGRSVLVTGFSFGGGPSYSAQLWDMESGREVHRFEPPLTELAFSPDGKSVLTSGAGEMKLWDALTGRQIRHLGQSNSRNTLFFPDGRSILTSTGQIWDVASGRQIRRLVAPLGLNFYSMLFSRDGRFLLTVGGSRGTNNDGLVQL